MDNAIGAPIKPHPDAEQFAACPLSLIICVEVDAQPPIRKITGASVSNEIFSMIVILVPVGPFWCQRRRRAAYQVFCSVARRTPTTGASDTLPAFQGS